MISEDKKYQCWLSNGDRILSFHPVLGNNPMVGATVAVAVAVAESQK